MDKVRAQKIVTLLLRDKVLVKISEDLVFHRERAAKLAEENAALKARPRRSTLPDSKT